MTFLWLVSLCSLVLSAQVLDKTGRNRPEPSQKGLIAQAKAQPDTIREELRKSLTAMVSARSDGERAAHLLRARQVAEAYRQVWGDQFLVNEVRRFASASALQRHQRVISDSLRIAGNAAMGAQGIPAAMILWRASLRHARTLQDPAAIAPALLSIGAGFYRLDQLDSASAYTKRARNIAVNIGDKRTEGNALGILASVTKDLGDEAAAAVLYRRALAIRALTGDSRGAAADENNLGLIAQQRGDFREAIASFERALVMNRRDQRFAAVALNLNNLATLNASLGEYHRAESLYREALGLHRKTGDRAETAFVQHGLGKLYMSRGDYREAKRILGEAFRTHVESGARAEAVAVEIDLAALESATGEPERARKLLEQAASAANAMKAPPADQALLALARADLAIKFGTFADADSQYSRAVRLYREARDSSGIGQALQGKALLLHWRGNDELAVALLAEARRIQLAAHDRRSFALTGLVVGDMLLARRELPSARRVVAESHATLRKLGDAVGESAALASIGDIALASGDVRAANAAYRSGFNRLGARAASGVRWRLNTGLAEALRSAGRLTAAAAEYRIAISAVERTAEGLRIEERRSGYLADKWDSYAQLALIEQARGRAAEAFAVSERMRARQMLDLLARGQVARVIPVSAHEQDLRRRIAILTQQLETGNSAASRARETMFDSPSESATMRELDAAQKAYTRLLVQLQENDPAYATLVSARTRSWRDLASRLAPDQVFLEYLLTDSASTVFVITVDTVAAIDLKVTRQDVADLVEFSRRTIDGPPNAINKELWRIPLRRLYLTLVQPVEKRGFLRGKRTLLIAPHAEVHFLSFASLIIPGTPDRFLIDRFDVAYTPSATVWLELGQRRFRQPSPGIVALAPNVARLPGSHREAAAIGRIYGRNAIVLTGPAATPAALRAALPNIGTVHLATFGVLNKHNPLFSFIELAPSGKDDGRLEVNEVFGLPLSGQLVVLSACQTALAAGSLADVPPGDDWVGLVQSFLQAGAGNVIASLWPVDDRATGELMEQFHLKRAKGKVPAAALAEAQRALIRNPATARPFYWAGFVSNGRSE